MGNGCREATAKKIAAIGSRGSPPKKNGACLALRRWRPLIRGTGVADRRFPVQGLSYSDLDIEIQGRQDPTEILECDLAGMPR